MKIFVEIMEDGVVTDVIVMIFGQELIVQFVLETTVVKIACIVVQLLMLLWPKVINAL